MAYQRSAQHERRRTRQRLIKTGMLGDHYFHVVGQGDKRMAGFSRFQVRTTSPFRLQPILTH